MSIVLTLYIGLVDLSDPIISIESECDMYNDQQRSELAQNTEPGQELFWSYYSLLIILLSCTPSDIREFIKTIYLLALVGLPLRMAGEDLKTAWFQHKYASWIIRIVCWRWMECAGCPFYHVYFLPVLMSGVYTGTQQSQSTQQSVNSVMLCTSAIAKQIICLTACVCVYIGIVPVWLKGVSPLCWWSLLCHLLSWKHGQTGWASR